MTTKTHILRAAQAQAHEAFKKFRHCKNRYAFKKEREIVARWNLLVNRLREKDPERYMPKKTPHLDFIKRLLGELRT